MHFLLIIEHANFDDTSSEDKAIFDEKTSISGLKFQTFCSLLHLLNNIQQNTPISKYANLKIRHLKIRHNNAQRVPKGRDQEVSNKTR